jgi:hypothetical protein
MHSLTMAPNGKDLADSEQILKEFSAVNIDPFWAFKDKTRSETTYLTHGFHRYPAKFIPQIPQELIERHTKLGDLVVDPFCGCGTTLVEAKIAGRRSVGVDINPVAVLISRAKTQVVSVRLLESVFAHLTETMQTYQPDVISRAHKNPRIDYWFKQPEKHKLAFLLGEIEKVTDRAAQDFFLCAFSSILRGCSIWLMKSNKPTRDPGKVPHDPFASFIKQARLMIKRYKAYIALLETKQFSNVSCDALRGDARCLPVEDDSVDLIVTSHPYVTSYEYC